MGLPWLPGNRLSGHRPPRNNAFAGDRLSLKHALPFGKRTPSLSVCQPSPPDSMPARKQNLAADCPCLVSKNIYPRELLPSAGALPCYCTPCSRSRSRGISPLSDVHAIWECHNWPESELLAFKRINCFFGPSFDRSDGWCVQRAGTPSEQSESCCSQSERLLLGHILGNPTRLASLLQPASDRQSMAALPVRSADRRADLHATVHARSFSHSVECAGAIPLCPPTGPPRPCHSKASCAACEWDRKQSRPVFGPHKNIAPPTLGLRHSERTNVVRFVLHTRQRRCAHKAAPRPDGGARRCVVGVRCRLTPYAGATVPLVATCAVRDRQPVLSKVLSIARTPTPGRRSRASRTRPVRVLPSVAPKRGQCKRAANERLTRCDQSWVSSLSSNVQSSWRHRLWRSVCAQHE